MKRKLYYIIGVFAAILAMSCEDLEDTYDEYAGDGIIRYVGKSADLNVEAGWKRLKVTWKNNLDAVIKRVKVTWQSDLDAQPFVRYIEQSADNVKERDTLFLEGLQNATYKVTVSNVDADSTESNALQFYARPYTEEHEDLRTFSRGIVNFYVLGDQMVVVLDENNENVIRMELNYYGTDGQEYTWDIKEHMADSLDFVYYGMNIGRSIRSYMQLLPESGSRIDFSKPVVIKREGRLTGCIDPVPLNDEVLSLQEKIWSTGFSLWMKKCYGPDWESRLDEIEEVELDYDMTTFVDLFYLPNLKKVVLGKNRYMAAGHTSENRSTTDDYKGLMTLQFLKDIRGITVERYNKHYFNGEFEAETDWGPIEDTYYNTLLSNGKIKSDLFTDKGSSNTMPAITPLDAADWKITCSDTTLHHATSNKLSNLLDNSVYTYFEPQKELGVVIYEITFDMKTPQTLNGFKVVQHTEDFWDFETALKHLISSLEIEVSSDGYLWEAATYDEGATTIGNALGETTLIPVKGGRLDNIRYVRISMANRPVDQLSGGVPLYSLRLSDFIPYTIQ